MHTPSLVEVVRKEDHFECTFSEALHCVLAESHHALSTGTATATRSLRVDSCTWGMGNGRPTHTWTPHTQEVVVVPLELVVG